MARNLTRSSSGTSSSSASSTTRSLKSSQDSSRFRKRSLGGGSSRVCSSCCSLAVWVSVAVSDTLLAFRWRLDGAQGGLQLLAQASFLELAPLGHKTGVEQIAPGAAVDHQQLQAPVPRAVRRVLDERGVQIVGAGTGR